MTPRRCAFFDNSVADVVKAYEAYGSPSCVGVNCWASIMLQYTVYMMVNSEFGKFAGHVLDLLIYGFHYYYTYPRVIVCF
jgi:hypothetical protein